MYKKITILIYFIKAETKNQLFIKMLDFLYHILAKLFKNRYMMSKLEPSNHFEKTKQL